MALLEMIRGGEGGEGGGGDEAPFRTRMNAAGRERFLITLNWRCGISGLPSTALNCIPHSSLSVGEAAVFAAGADQIILIVPIVSAPPPQC